MGDSTQRGHDKQIEISEYLLFYLHQGHTFGVKSKGIQEAFIQMEYQSEYHNGAEIFLKNLLFCNSWKSVFSPAPKQIAGYISVI